MKHVLAPLVILLCLGCSSEEPGKIAPPQSSVEEARPPAGSPAATSTTSPGALSMIPDACELLTQEDASQILGVAATRYEPRVNCSYLEDGVSKMTSRVVSATVYCPATQGRNWEELSQEQLIEQLRLNMMGGDFVRSEPGIGRRTLVFTMKLGNKMGVVVHVGTGIQYRDERGGGELVIEVTTSNYPEGEVPIDHAVATARTVMNKLDGMAP